MIKSCVIGLSKVGIIHCKSLIKIKKTSLNYIFDKGFHFFDLACWLSNSKPEKMIVISKSISSEDFLNNGDFSDAIINLKLRNGIVVEIVFSRKCRFGNFEKIKVYGEKFSLDSDDFSDKKTLYDDFSVRHRKSYLNCLKKFIESKNNCLLYTSDAADE